MVSECLLASDRWIVGTFTALMLLCVGVTGYWTGVVIYNSM